MRSRRSRASFVDIAVGQGYERRLGDGSSTPWLEDNENLQQQIANDKWLRWDGTEGTAREHILWMKERAKSFMSKEREEEYREYGQKNNCKFYIHDELTKEGQGYGFFKIEGTLQLDPRDMVACCFDMKGIAAIDRTVVLMKILQKYVGNRQDDPFCLAVYWANAPGFPFYYRDGVDISGYDKDEDGVVWQLSVSARGKDFVSMPGSIAATDRFWAYRLEPNKKDGTTKTTLICQTILNGWIPKSLSNYFTCSVLIDYMSTTEQQVQKNKASGEHQKLLKQLELENV